MARKIHLNDEVVVITGKDKGKKGLVIEIVSKNKIKVKGINVVKKHQKSIPDRNQIGGIVQKESYIDISNVKIFNKYTEKPDRVGFIFKNGIKFRFFKSNNMIIK